MIHLLDLQFLGHEDTIAAFLVKTDAGPILFETGPHSCWASLTAELAKHEVRPEEIKHVFLTHIHLDHAGAAWAFAEHGAKIYVHPRGIKHLHDPSRLMASATRIYQDQMDRLWGQMRGIPMEQLIAVEQGVKIQIGSTEIVGWHTPGHAVHHIAWQIGKDLLCGDAAGVQIRGGLVVPPCPPPDIQVEDWQESIQLMRKLEVDRLWLTHFGPVDQREAHLQLLEEQLLRYAAWMRPHFMEGTAPEEITPLFQEFTQGLLLEKGVPKEDLVQYEAANPSWMSVAGLLRYWKKRTEHEEAIE